MNTAFISYQSNDEISDIMNKKFAAKCNRPLILQGCEMLGMSIEDVSEICIEGMKKHAAELHLTPEALTD